MGNEQFVRLSDDIAQAACERVQALVEAGKTVEEAVAITIEGIREGVTRLRAAAEDRIVCYAGDTYGDF